MNLPLPVSCYVRWGLFVRVWLFRYRNPRRFYVSSFEPFSREPIMRGPYTFSEAKRLVGINTGCGSQDVLFEDIDGVLSPV